MAGKLPHVLVKVKSVLFPVYVTMFVIVRSALPVLVNVTTWGAVGVPTGWFPKLRLAGEKVTPGPSPTPVKYTIWGLLAALSAMVKVPDRVP